VFHAAKPRVWAEIKLANLGGIRNFDVHPDGRRMVVVAAPDPSVAATPNKAVIYFDLFDELRQAVPAGR
jgi:hypothetical protein